jgi:hypothetical protein
MFLKTPPGDIAYATTVGAPPLETYANRSSPVMTSQHPAVWLVGWAATLVNPPPVPNR